MENSSKRSFQSEATYRRYREIYKKNKICVDGYAKQNFKQVSG